MHIKKLKVRDIMSENPVCCKEDARLDQVARLMAEHDCGAIPVVEDLENRKPVGIVTDRDIVVRALAKGRNPMELTAGECLTPNPLKITTDSSVEECYALMEKKQVRRVLVVDAKGACIGIVAQADLARNLSEKEVGEVVEEVSRPSRPQ